jgi:hypothetical protein
MELKNSIFKDAKRQAAFDRDGYVRIGLLNPEQVERLVNCYEKNKAEHQKVGTSHHTSTDTQNLQLIVEEDALIKELFVRELDKVMVDYKPLVGCFHIKESGQGTATGIHQDPTFVDDRRYVSANVWVALHDIDSSNGNLFFVKGSHRVSDTLRVTPNSPVYYHSFAGSLREMATEVPLKAGEAVIFNNATIHGATDNQSAQRRLAATLLVCSKEAQWQIYYNDEARAELPIERYDLDFEVFINMQKNGRPSQTALREKMNYVFPEVSEQEFREKTGLRSNKSNPILEFFKAIYKG